MELTQAESAAGGSTGSTGSSNDLGNGDSSNASASVSGADDWMVLLGGVIAGN